MKRILSGWPVAGRSSEAEDTTCLQDRMSVQAVQCREQKCREYENAQIDQQTLCPLGAPGKIPGNTSAQQRLRHIHGKADLPQIYQYRTAENAGMTQESLTAEGDHHSDKQQVKDDQSGLSVHCTAHVGD